MTGLIDALVGLTRQERWLIGLLFGVVVPVALVFLLILPLLEARAQAVQALRDSEQVLRWVETQARIYPAGGAESAPAQRPAPGLAGLEESLVSAGLRTAVSALSNRRAGTVEVRFDAVGFAALMGWMTTVETATGYRPDAFTLEQTGAPGQVAATLLLEPQV